VAFSQVVRAVVETLGSWDRLSSAAEARVTVRIPEAVALRVSVAGACRRLHHGGRFPLRPLR